MINHHGDMHNGIEASDDLGLVSVLVKGVIMAPSQKLVRIIVERHFWLNYSDENFPENL